MFVIVLFFMFWLGSPGSSSSPFLWLQFGVEGENVSELEGPPSALLGYTSTHILIFFLGMAVPPPKALRQGGLTMGSVSVHGEPKFSEGQPLVFTNLVRVENTA